MNPVNKQELEEIKKDYDTFKLKGNSVFKSAFLSVYKHGFCDLNEGQFPSIVKKEKDTLVMVRPEDETYIVVKIREEEIKTFIKVLCAFFYNAL